MLILAHWSISLFLCVLYMFFSLVIFVKASDLYYLLTDLLEDNMKRTEGQVSWFSGSTALFESCRLYLLADQCRIIEGVELLSNYCLLGWSLLPAFRPMQDNGRRELPTNCCLLVWVSATCFQTNAG